MKKIARKTKNIIKKIFVVVWALLTIAILTAAIITLSKILFVIFAFCFAVYWMFIVLETIVFPLLRRK